MRRKKEAVLCFESKDAGLPKVVRDYRARFRAISQVLDAGAGTDFGKLVGSGTRVVDFTGGG